MNDELFFYRTLHVRNIKKYFIRRMKNTNKKFGKSVCKKKVNPTLSIIFFRGILLPQTGDNFSYIEMKS